MRSVPLTCDECEADLTFHELQLRDGRRRHQLRCEECGWADPPTFTVVQAVTAMVQGVQVLIGYIRVPADDQSDMSATLKTTRGTNV